MLHPELEHLAVLDFGGQYAHLIATRIRHMGVYSEIHFPSSDPSSLPDLGGVIFSGGEDIDPKHFGEELHPDCGTIIPERDAQELFGYKYLLTTGKPFLAICRGIQLMNVAEGGTLYQDIPAQLPKITIRHSQPATADSAHHADILPGTLLRSLVGADRVPVNSRHHQVVKDVAPGLRVSALSEDGLVEGLEFENGYPGIGTQWHPENLSKRREDMQSLFNWLVAKAAERA